MPSGGQEEIFVQMPAVGGGGSVVLGGHRGWNNPRGYWGGKKKDAQMSLGEMGGSGGTIRTALRLETSDQRLENVLFCECSNIHESRESY